MGRTHYSKLPMKTRLILTGVTFVVMGFLFFVPLRKCGRCDGTGRDGCRGCDGDGKLTLFEIIRGED